MKVRNIKPFYFLLLLMCLLTTRSFSQNDSSLVVKGYISDGETLADLGGVHVYNSKGNVTISDIRGFFRIKVGANDTLTFSRIDYETKALAVRNLPSGNLVVTMQQKTYILDTVDVYAEYTVPSYLLKPERKPANIQGITRYVDPEKDYHLGVGGSLSSPVTALYQLFSKRYQEEKKVHELEKIEAKEDVVREKAYARIDEILELKEVRLFDEEYEMLVDHCNLNLDWVAESNNYDLYLRMEDCLDDFLKKEGIKTK